MVDTSRGHWRRALIGEHEMGLGLLVFVLLGPPLAWTGHFLTIYFVDTLLCTTGTRTGLVPAVIVLTVLFAVVSAAAGVMAYRRWKGIRRDESWSESLVRDNDRTVFLLMMGLVGSVVFTLLIVVEGLPPFFVPTCSEFVS